MGDCDLDALLDVLDEDDEAFLEAAMDDPEAVTEDSEPVEENPELGNDEESEMALKLREMEEQVRMMKEKLAQNKKPKSQTASSGSEGGGEKSKVTEIDMFTASSASKSRYSNHPPLVHADSRPPGPWPAL